ncbi:MAG: thiol reductant ABC exporter subunit CydC [Angustibacter sp.]
MALRRVVAALEPSPGRVLGAVAAGSAALGSAVALAAVSSWLISRAAEHPPVLDLSVAVVAVRALGISRGTFRYVERLASHDVALRGVVRLRERLYERLAWADRGVVSGLRSGELLSRVGADVDLVADVVVRGLLPFAVAAVVCAATVALLAWVLPLAAAVVAGALLLALVAAPRLAAVAAGRYEQAADRTRAEVSAQVHALLDGATELTVAGRVDERLALLRAADAVRRRELDRAARPAAWAATLSSVLTGVAVVGALVVGSAATASGRLDGVLLAVVTLTPLALVEVVAPLPAAAVAVVRARGAAERLTALLDAPPAHSAAERPVPTGPHHLRAHGIDVGWPDSAPVLRGVSLDLEPGRVLAVVGASGGGKSTLLRTLAGLLEPLRGNVLLDGVALADLDPTALRRTVTLTAEDAHVFATTLRDNLLVARGDATDDDLWAVLRLVHLDQWATGLDDGLATVLDPGSVSGGERRRLLLARALLVDSAVVLLDEPGEHLDPLLADRLLRDLVGAARARGVTMVVVTHRLEPLDCVDEVVTIRAGQVTSRSVEGRWRSASALV